MRAARMGIGVGSMAVRALLVRRGQITWVAQRPIASPDDIRDAIRILVGSAPSQRWRRTRVHVALGPSVVQVRELTNLPPAKDARTLSRILKENQGRFFLRNGIPLVTTDVVITGSAIFGAAAERPVLDAISDGCRDAGASVSSIVPACFALRRAVERGGFTWRDGAFSVEVSGEHDRPAPRRLARAGSAPIAISAVLAPALAALGADAQEYADAFGAVILRKGSPIAFSVSDRSASSSMVRRIRFVAAASTAVLALVVVFVAPGIVAIRAARNAEARLARLSATRQAVMQTQSRLRDVTLALTELAAFDRHRRSSIGVLAALTAALPQGSALVSLRLDSIGGSLVALSPRAAAVLGRLDKMPGIVGAEIVGPVTREFMTGKETERAAIKFSFARARASQ